MTSSRAWPWQLVHKRGKIIGDKKSSYYGAKLHRSYLWMQYPSGMMEDSEWRGKPEPRNQIFCEPEAAPGSRRWETLGNSGSVFCLHGPKRFSPRNTGEWKWYMEQRECQSCLLTLKWERCETTKPAAHRADGRFYFKGGQSGFFQSGFNLIFGLFPSPLRNSDFIWLFPE